MRHGVLKVSGASGAKPLQAVLTSANCSARPLAVAVHNSLNSSPVPRDLSGPASRRAFEARFGPMVIRTGYGRDILEYRKNRKALWLAWEAGRRWGVREIAAEVMTALTRSGQRAGLPNADIRHGESKP